MNNSDSRKIVIPVNAVFTPVIPITVSNNSFAALPAAPIDVAVPDVVPEIKKIDFKPLNFISQHSLVSFSLIILLIAVVASPIVKNLVNYQTAQPLAASDHTKLPGLNIAVDKSNYANWLSQYTNQPASINLGSKTVNVSADTLKSWITSTYSNSAKKYSIHLNTSLISSSLLSLAQSYQIKPINQVDIVKSNGSNETAVYGRNGFNLENTSLITQQADGLSKNLFDFKGFQVNAPLVTVPFTKTTPNDFDKLIVVDVNSKVMYVYQNGQIINTYLVSAGAPLTPTPIGEFHIYSKYAVQNMHGTNPNGTPYFQPNVKWVSYFTGADAIHGVYWHPLSWFGVHNSSHGCVGLPDNEAQWIFNWAPIGTTVITTPN